MPFFLHLLVSFVFALFVLLPFLLVALFCMVCGALCTASDDWLFYGLEFLNLGFCQAD